MPTLWMLGHSDRTFPVFLELLRSHEIAHLVDVRRYPASRRHPQFDRLELERRLPARDVQYSWMPRLGGMRQPVQGSDLNAAWKDDGFRAYADHMGTRAFGGAVKRVLGLAASRRTVLMCAEADPLRCHRQLLADELVLSGAEVLHVLDERRLEPHALHPLARAAPDGGVLYKAGRVQQGELF